jgi:ABC-2 type transport system permease protein
MTAIFLKETKTFFNTLRAYVFISLFLLIGGAVFAAVNIADEVTATRSMIEGMQYALFLITPLLTARQLCHMSGADRTLLSAPLSTRAIVAGKFFSAMSVLMAAAAVSLIYPLILSVLGNPSWSEIASGYLGLLLLGTMLIAIGLFISAASAGARSAGTGTLGIMLMILLAQAVIPRVNNEWLKTTLLYTTPSYHTYFFESGMLSLPSAVYFVSLTLLFLYAAVKAVEYKKRS